jgi:hypothetical protein
MSVLFFSLYLVKSDNKSVLSFILELMFAILNIDMESKIIKDKGTLIHCKLLKPSLWDTENLKPSSLNYQEPHLWMRDGACGVLFKTDVTIAGLFEEA